MGHSETFFQVYEILFKGFFLFLKVLEELRKILRDDLGLKTTPPPLFIFYLRHNRKKKIEIVEIV